MQLAFVNALDARALLAFDQHLDGAVRQLQHLQYCGDAADIKHVGDQWVVFGSGLLGHQHDSTVGFHGCFKSLDAFWAPHKQGNDHVREHHHVAQRQQWQIEWGGRQRGMTRHGETFSLPVKNILGSDFVRSRLFGHFAVNQQRRLVFFDGGFIHHHFVHIGDIRQIKHGVDQ